MRVRVTYIDSHFDDGLTSVIYNVDNVETANARWWDAHLACSCTYVNTHRT